MGLRADVRRFLRADHFFRKGETGTLGTTPSLPEPGCVWYLLGFLRAQSIVEGEVQVWEDLLARVPGSTKGRPKNQAGPLIGKTAEVTISQGLVNAIIGVWSDGREAGDVERFSPELEIASGYTDVRALAYGAADVLAQVRLEIVSAQVSRANQTLVFRSIDPVPIGGDRRHELLALGLGAALFSVFFQKSPLDPGLGGNLALSSDGNHYTVSLQKPGLAAIFRSSAIVQEALERFEVTNVTCAPGAFVISATVIRATF